MAEKPYVYWGDNGLPELWPFGQGVGDSIAYDQEDCKEIPGWDLLVTREEKEEALWKDFWE